ncbi:MAG: preprotein translocase subunit SecE [Lachnospiraceae bacterium]|nr:preprotein translocase subunit SecE [Lachnospiraceae bacterium]
MGEANTDVKGGKTKTPKKGFIKGLKAEFKKIIWPDKQSTARETTAVIIVSVILGIVIKVFDLIIQFGLDKLIAH